MLLKTLFKFHVIIIFTKIILTIKHNFITILVSQLTDFIDRKQLIGLKLSLESKNDILSHKLEANDNKRHNSIKLKKLSSS